MRLFRPSRTAIGVAVWRGLGAYDLPDTGHDPIAKQLVPPVYGVLLRLAERFPTVTSGVMRAAGVLSLGLSHHLPLRTRAIDEALAAEWPRGTDQLVLLGAGLDARAYRLAGLEGVDVYEVDFPSTQAYKRAATAGLVAKARAVHYVAIDFLRESLVERLLETGFDVMRPAVFVWEGVTMYLDDAAIDATLAALQTLATDGSLLAVTYQTTGLPIASRLAGVGFALAGEPLLHRVAPDRFAAQLAAHGFVVESDAGDRQWAKRWGYGRIALPMTERLALARR